MQIFISDEKLVTGTYCINSKIKKNIIKIILPIEYSKNKKNIIRIIMLIIYLNERNTFLEHLNEAGMRIIRKSGVLTSIKGKETGSLIKTFHKENSFFGFTGKFFYIIKKEIILVLIFPSNKKNRMSLYIL